MPAVRTSHVSCKCCAPSQTFETMRELNDHKKDQRGSQPVCEWVVNGIRCGKEYRNSTNLKDHERKAHTKEVTEQCRECHKLFYARCDVTNHQYEHHPEIMYHCKERTCSFKGATDVDGFKRHVKRAHFKSKHTEGEEFEEAWKELITNPEREATPEGELRQPPAPSIRLGPPRRIPHAQMFALVEPSTSILAGTSSLGLYIPSTTGEASYGVFSAPPPYTTNATSAIPTPAFSPPSGASLGSSFTSPSVNSPPEYSSQSSQPSPHYASSSSGLSTGLPPSSFVAIDPSHQISSSVAPFSPKAPVPTPYDFSCGSDQLSLPALGSEYDYPLQQPEPILDSSSAATNFSVFDHPPALTDTLGGPCGESSQIVGQRYSDASLGMENFNAGLFPSFDYDSETWMAALNASLYWSTSGQADQQFHQSAPFPLNYPTIG